MDELGRSSASAGVNAGDAPEAEPAFALEPAPSAPPVPSQRDELASRQRLEETRGPGAGALGRGIQLTPWLQARARFRSSATRDNNVFRDTRLGPDKPVDDISLVQTLGFDLVGASERGDLQVRLGYRVDYRSWLENHQLDRDEHQLNLGLDLLRQRTNVRFAARLAHLARPDDPRVTGGLVRRLVIDARLSWDVRFTEKVGALVEGTVFYQNFLDKDFSGEDQFGPGVNAFVTALAPMGVTFLLGGGYRELDFPDKDATASDLAVFNVAGGVQVARPRFQAQLRTGYETSTITRQRLVPRDGDEPSGMFALGSGELTLVNGVRLGLEVTHQISFLVFSAAQTISVLRGSLFVPLNERLAATGGVSWEHQTLDETPDLYAWRWTASLRYTLRPWLELDAFGSFQSVRQRGNNYEVLQAGVALTFRL